MISTYNLRFYNKPTVNTIEESGAKSLSEALKMNTTLTKLSMTSIHTECLLAVVLFSMLSD